MSHLKRTFTKSSGCCVSHMDYKPGVSTTQMMSLSRESRSHSINKSYIPMRAVNGNKSWIRIVDGSKTLLLLFQWNLFFIGSVLQRRQTDKLKLVLDGQSNIIILKYRHENVVIFVFIRRVYWSAGHFSLPWKVLVVIYLWEAFDYNHVW